MITNLGAIRRAHAQLIRDTKAATLKASIGAANHGIRWSRSYAGYSHRTGTLKRATRKRIVRLKSGARVILQNTAKHAHFIEHGTRPHWIYPRRPGGRLVFWWDKTGRVMHLRRVWHPGTRPYRFLHNATHQASLRFGTLIAPELAKAAARF